jgi:hypothetical protein
LNGRKRRGACRQVSQGSETSHVNFPLAFIGRGSEPQRLPFAGSSCCCRTQEGQRHQRLLSTCGAGTAFAHGDPCARPLSRSLIVVVPPRITSAIPTDRHDSPRSTPVTVAEFRPCLVHTKLPSTPNFLSYHIISKIFYTHKLSTLNFYPISETKHNLNYKFFL